MPFKNPYIILAFSLLFLTGVNVHGQDQLISLKYSNTSLRIIMDDLEDQSGLRFSYSNRLLDDTSELSVSIINASVEEALKDIFSGMKVRFILLEKQIILKKEKQRKTTIPESKPGEVIVEKRYTVSGYVKDLLSDEILIGATISLPDGSEGAITNKYGFYSITISSKSDSLVCTYVGYGKQKKALTGNVQTIDFQLNEHRQSLKEVVIIGDEYIETIRTSRTSEQKLRTDVVRKMAALFGEKDVIKSLSSIPGIKFFGDGSTIFYVRGGARDQNLVLIDEAPVYNPTHLMGFFSTVVPDAVKDIQVYKGDFPANYGGRLSSLIDIRTKDGNMNQFGMDGSVGLLSTKLSIEGPVWKEHISYFISSRRSHILKPIKNYNENLKDLQFRDFHFKMNYRINKKNRIFFSLYRSIDNFENSDGQGRVSGINWTNSTATIRWNHLFSDNLFCNTTMYASHYDYFFNTNILTGDYWQSHINSFSLKSDFTWYISPSNTLRYGVNIGQHFINPGNYYTNYTLLALQYPISTRSVNENNFYLSDQIVLSDQLSLRYGLRFNAWHNVGEAWEYSYDGQLNTTHYPSGQIYNSIFTGDPRFGLVYKTDNDDLFKISLSRTSQFQHLITNSVSPFSSLEVWLPSGPNIKPQRASQLTIGYTHKFEEKGIVAEAELYYKSMKNQIDYRDHAKLLMNPFIEYELRFGDGEAYGLETMISKKKGRLSGWISYTLSRSFMDIEDINNGKPYPSYGDRPHDLSVFVSYEIRPRLHVSGNFIYMTGAPITTPTAFYYQDNIQIPIYFQRNNDRLPDYHRLDLALNWNLRKKEGRFKHELIFSIYNAYGRKNPVALHFNKIENEIGKLVTPYNYYETPELTPTQFYVYQVVPSVSYHFWF